MMFNANENILYEHTLLFTLLIWKLYGLYIYNRAGIHLFRGI